MLRPFRSIVSKEEFARKMAKDDYRTESFWKGIYEDINSRFTILIDRSLTPKEAGPFWDDNVIDDKIEEFRDNILQTAEDLKLTLGRRPASMMAAASYIARYLLGRRKTQIEIAEETGVSTTTIRTRYKELAAHLLFITEL